jgi:hopanoid biosynthesis associated protein HpnK
MTEANSYRRLIVNADDFGLSHGVNEAVIRAHQHGVLTTASLMVNEAGFSEAVDLARANPRLGVGLHLSLVHGRSALSHAEIPGLVDGQGRFSSAPTSAGARFFFRPSLRSQVRAEIRAQLGKFASTGLKLDHVNGHLHLHLHPTVLSILLELAPEFGISRVRLTRDRFWLNARLADGRWLYRATHAIIFAALAAKARHAFERRGIRHTSAVFGLLQDSRVDESYVCGLLPHLPRGDSELYSHPSLDDSKHELDALLSGRVRQRLRELRIELIRYQDL